MTSGESEMRGVVGPQEPFRSPCQEAAVALLCTAELLKRHFSDVLQTHGITLQQYNVLRILRGAGREGLPTLEVAHRMIERAPGITRMMDRLEMKGWVKRMRDPEDRRQVYCLLTDAGRQVLRELDEPMDRVDERVVGVVSRANQRKLIELLNEIGRGLQGGPTIGDGAKEATALGVGPRFGRSATLGMTPPGAS